MLLKDFINTSKERLSAVYPEAEAKNLINLITENFLGAQSYTHIVKPDFQVSGKPLEAAQNAIERLIAEEPLQYVLGHANFYGRKFDVTPDVLIPRQETELLCKIAIEETGRKLRMRKAFGKSAAPVKILDMCTGSGCIAWTIALEVPGVDVFGVDISEEALKVAQKQPLGKEAVELNTKIPKFSIMDVLDTDAECPSAPFDIIVSNPPYVMEKEKALMNRNVLEHEPELALFVPDDDPLKFYSAIQTWADKILAPGGVAVMEINEALGAETAALFKATPYDKVEIIEDLCGKNRIIRYTKPSL